MARNIPLIEPDPDRTPHNNTDDENEIYVLCRPLEDILLPPTKRKSALNPSGYEQHFLSLSAACMDRWDGLDSILAFNILLSMADASHTDLDASCKMCGTTCDESAPAFKLLDEALLPLNVYSVALVSPNVVSFDNRFQPIDDSLGAIDGDTVIDHHGCSTGIWGGMNRNSASFRSYRT
ncbi:hypothetical protein V8E54_008443 [Elaphomyces granulatus]